MVIMCVTAAPLFVRQKARGQHPLVTPIWSGDRASERLRLQPDAQGSVNPGRTPIYG